MRKADLLALAARVEAAEGADRALDAEIALAAGWKQLRQAQAWWRPEHVAEARKRRKALWVWGPTQLPAFTASLDAAASLVPKKCLYFVRTLWDESGKAGYAGVTRYTAAPKRVFINETAGVAASPALALTAAALRAIAEEARDD
jgi:hypothetical protein